MSHRLKGCLKIGLGLIVLAVCALLVAWRMFDHPVPQGQDPAAGDRITRQLMSDVNCEAWQQVKVVQWTFRGQHTHIWDRQRGLVQSRLGELTTWLRTSDQTGYAEQNGHPLSGPDLEEALRNGWSAFINDAFWLNPFCTFFHEGSQRLVAEFAGEQGLLVAYNEGGVTPGDRYWIAIGSDGLPTQWRMWAEILPLGGVPTSWDGWFQCHEGAWLATYHRLGPLTIDLQIQTSPDVETLTGGDDPFSRLMTLN